jgi:hypothetical protein
VELFDGLPGFLTPLQAGSHVRSLRVQELDGASAFCDCDIVTTADYGTAVWRGRALGRITAPLVLERTRPFSSLPEPSPQAWQQLRQPVA